MVFWFLLFVCFSGEKLIHFLVKVVTVVVYLTTSEIANTTYWNFVLYFWGAVQKFSNNVYDA